MPNSKPLLPPVEEIAANLAAIRATATPAQVTEGRAWYPAMGRLIREIALEAFDHTGDVADQRIAVGVFCAFSQNATWKANVTMAGNYLRGSGRGMRSVLDECESMEDGNDPWIVLHGRKGVGFKRPAFYRNLLGDLSQVTCDRWHLRAAFGKEKMPLTRAVYDLVSQATRMVAAEYREQPAETQAVIWCAIRGDGK